MWARQKGLAVEEYDVKIPRHQRCNLLKKKCFVRIVSTGLTVGGVEAEVISGVRFVNKIKEAFAVTCLFLENNDILKALLTSQRSFSIQRSEW